MNHDVLEDELRDLLFSSWTQYKSTPKPKPYKNKNPFTPSEGEVIRASLNEAGIWVACT